MASFSQTIGRRLRQAARPASAGSASPHQEMIALANGQKLWATRVPRREWCDLQAGHELLLLRVGAASIEMATVLDTAGPPEVLALAWGYHAPGEADTRPATLVHYRDVARILRYELRDTGCPDVVATILPTPN